MSNPRPSAEHRPAIRHRSSNGSWRSPPSESARRFARLVRRLLITAVAVGLAALLMLLLWMPFQRPRTELLTLIQASPHDLTNERLLSACPPVFAAEDAGAFDALQAVLYHSSGQGQPLHLTGDTASDALRNLAAALDGATDASSDVLILYVTAQGIAADGTAWLCWDAQPDAPESHRMNLLDLLKRLESHSARTRLLILDSGRIAHDPRRGILINDFPRLLREQVEALDDPNLWVLHSHSPLQRSHLARSLHRSVFGEFVVRGLGGAADANADEIVDLSELARYVAANVSSWVRELTGAAAAQTPMLLWAGGPKVPASRLPQLIAVPPQPKTIPKISQQDSSDAKTIATALGAPSAPTAPTISTPAPVTAAQSVAAPRLAAQRVANASADESGEQPPANGESASPTPTSPAGESPANSGQTPDAASSSDPNPAEPNGSAAANQAVAPSVAAARAALAARPPVTGADLPALLQGAWQLRDDLAARSETTLRPLDYAPHLWREFQQQLLTYEQIARSGTAAAASAEAAAFALRDLQIEWRAAAVGAVAFRGNSLPARLSALRPQPPAIDQPQSIAMAQWLARHGGPPLPDELRRTVESLDRSLEANERTLFDKWIGELDRKYDRFSEFRLCRQLQPLADVAWPTIQSTTRINRLAEATALAALECIPWVATELDQAERMRLEAERLLLDQVGGQRERRARELQAGAENAYVRVQRDATRVVSARRLLHDLYDRAPWYLHWRARLGADLPSRGPTFRQLDELLQNLERLTVLLSAPDSQQLTALAHLSTRLEQQQAQIEASLEPRAIERLVTAPVADGDAWQIEVLLSMPLLSADGRQRLIAAAETIERQSLSDWKRPSTPSTLPQPLPASADVLRFLFVQAALERKLVRLAGISEDSAQAKTSHQAPHAAESQPPGVPPDVSNDEAFLQLQRLARELERDWQTLPSTARATPAVATAAGRTAEIAQWQQSARALRLLDARDTPLLPEPIEVFGQLQSERLFDFLRFQEQRQRSAAADAPAPERAVLLAAAEEYRHQAALLRPLNDPPPLPALSIHAENEISLVAAREQVLELRIESSNLQPQPVWVVLDYDPAIIDVQIPAEHRVYRDNELRDELHRLRADANRATAVLAASEGHDPLELESTRRRAAALERANAYPRRPDLAGLPATFRSSRSISPPLRLVVRRRSDVSRPAKLIVRAIGAGALIRRDVAVHLPAPESIQVLVDGTPGSWIDAPDGLVLLPFPNRATEFTVSLRNSGPESRNVEVELFALAAPYALPLPRAGLSQAEAARLISSLPRPQPVVSKLTLALPPGDVPVPIPFPEPGAKAAQSAEPAGGPAQPQPTNDAVPTGPAAIPLPAGLVLAVTDSQTSQVFLRKIELRPQRPRRYVRPRVGYNFAAERIEVTVVPEDPALLPPGGSHIRCEFVEPLPPGTEAQLVATLRPGDREARLFAAVPAAADRNVTLQLSIDGYPRCFTYRVPCNAQAADLPETLDRLEVRVVAPAETSAWLAPVESIPVAVQIDAPPAAFGSVHDFVEIGIDRNRDRLLTGDNPLRFDFDRDVRINLQELAPGGRLVVGTQIGDIQVEVPAAGLQNVRADVLARVVAGRRVAWSRSVEVVFDAAPPQVESVSLLPDRVVMLGRDLEVRAVCSDALLSGVERVEAAVDAARIGKFGEEPKPVPLAQDETGRWIGRVGTGDLKSGVYTLLVRATDRVGNVSDYAKVKFTARSEEELAAATTGATNRVTGVVVYGDDPVPSAQVELELPDGKKLGPAGVDSQGRFSFPEVPVGKAKLTVQTDAVRNRKRKGAAEIEVVPPPAEVESVRIRVR